MHKSKVVEIVSVISLVVLIIVGIISFKFSQEIKRLELEVDRDKNIKNSLRLENEKLKEQNELTDESLKDQKDKLQKYQNLLESTIKENDKIYADLNTTIKDNKTTIENLKKEIETLKNTVAKKDIEITDLKKLLNTEQSNNKIISERLQTAIKDAEAILTFVNNKIEENKDNQAVVNILTEIKTDLEPIINND